MPDYVPKPKSTGDQLTSAEWTAASNELEEQEVKDVEQDAALTALLSSISTVDLAVPQITDPVDFNSLVTPGFFWIGGSFLNGDAPDPNTYNVPGNSGPVFIMIVTCQLSGNLVIFQRFWSMDGNTKGAQRRRWEGTWSGWAWT
jgi:hypothetical protein